MISYLPAPKEHEHFLPRQWSGLRFRRLDHDASEVEYVLGVGTIPALITSTYITLMIRRSDNNTGAAAALAGSPVQRRHGPDRETFGGVDSLVVFPSGDARTPAPIRCRSSG